MITKEQILKAVEMKRAHKPHKEIANEIGATPVAVTSLFQRLRKEGVNLPSCRTNELAEALRELKK